MMLTSILMLVIVVLIISFIAYFITGNRRVKQLQNTLLLNEENLKKTNAREKDLKEKLEKLESTLSHAIKDPVTGLLGWELFEDRLNQSIKESSRYQFTQAIFYIDINEFKKINNALGYEIGDSLLAAIATRLETCIRQVDSLTRFAKDTFVCLLTQLAKPETAAIVAQRMLQALSQPFPIKEQDIYVTACIGIAIYPTDGQDAAALLRKGENALHLAKEKGKHAYQFYHEKMHINSQRELALSTGLNNESASLEFVLFYEPIINTKKNNIFCIDALLYWQHHTLGLIDSQELFNYAEKQRKQNKLTEWMLQEACRQFIKWRSLTTENILLGIPISIRQLETSHFIYRLSQIMQELQFKPDQLLLAIKVTDSQLSFDVLEKAFNMLTYLGVRIAIDHFGANPFLLTYLKKITIHYLKMDASLIDDIDKNPQTIALVKSLIFLTDETSMHLIAEGVATPEQKNRLQALGCDLMQGPLFSLPLPQQKMIEKLPTVLKQS